MLNYKLMPILLAILVVSIAIPTTISASTNNDETLSITGNGKTAALALKAVEEDGDTNKVDNFELTAENVLQIEKGDDAKITNDVTFDKARTTDINDNEKEIDIDNDGNIDFSSYPQGTYRLQVITENGDRKLFEGIVAIGPQNDNDVRKQIQKTIVETIIDIEIIFEEDGGCNDEEGSAGLSYPYDNISECHVEELTQCEIDKRQGKEETRECATAEERFSDDCEGFANSEECDAYFTDEDKFCLENPDHGACPKIEPITPTPEPTPQLIPTPPIQGLVPQEPIDCPEGSRPLDYPQTGCEPIDIPNEETESLTPEPTPPITEIPNEEGLTEIPKVTSEETPKEEEEKEIEEEEKVVEEEKPEEPEEEEKEEQEVTEEE